MRPIDSEALPWYEGLRHFLQDYRDYLEALAVAERMRRGEEETYSFEDIEKKFGL